MKNTRLNRVRHYSVRLAVFAMALAVSAGILEVCLWVFCPIPWDEFLAWQPDGHIAGRAVPGQVIRTSNGNEVSINKWGFRGPENWDRQPQEGTLRIVALGGSSTFNFKVSDDTKTWSKQLELQLKKRGITNVEVLNLGLPGFDASNSKINYLFTGRALSPHVVIVYHTWNDMKAFREIEEGNPMCFGHVARKHPLWKRVLRETQIGRRGKTLLRKRSQLMNENQYSDINPDDSKAGLAIQPAALEWFRQNFVDLARFTSNDDVLCVFVSQATIAQSENISKQEMRERIGVSGQGMTYRVVAETWIKCNSIIESVAHAHGAIFINGRDAVPPDLDHLRDHVHLTDLGTSNLADCIADGLIRDDRFLRLAETVRESHDP